MKEKIKGYWRIIIIALLIGGAFYWFQLRPANIRGECSKELERSGISLEAREFYYKKCLREYGLEK